MREQRGRSQILFGHLPGQTIDMRGRIWRVAEWKNPAPRPVDDGTLRDALLFAIVPWSKSGRDGGYAEDLRSRRAVSVVEVDGRGGVAVEPFPKVWFCQACKRVGFSADVPCRCGTRRWRQLQFVAYHECGFMGAPWIPKCPTHRQVTVRFPEAASAAEITFSCPECGRTLQRGFGLPPCSCGTGRILHTVHRAASVYTPRMVVVVTPPSMAKAASLLAADVGRRAVAWVLDGMGDPILGGASRTAADLTVQLTQQGFGREVVEAMVSAAISAGGVERDGDDESAGVHTGEPGPADREAIDIAVALSTGHSRVSSLAEVTGEGSARAELFRTEYPRALERCGLEEVELVPRFPVLTAAYGYTRGGADAGTSRLVPYRDRRENYVCYGELAETEALFVRLRPTRVLEWLRQRGARVGVPGTERSAREEILRHVRIPSVHGDEGDLLPEGTTLLMLIHSFSHRFLRLAAVHAGIESTGLAEYLVPRHLGFFIYAASRGGFVLGGLEAVFERSLHRLLDSLVDSERRCVLDPGCLAAGGACMACLHVGEPSCRHYNRFLSRSTLFGEGGYLTPPRGGSEAETLSM